MSRNRWILCVVFTGSLALGMSAEALEPIGIQGLTTIPIADRDDVYHLEIGGGGQRWDCQDPTEVYDNDADSYMYLRVPDPVDGTLWLAEDIELELPDGSDSWGICSYGYLTYAYGGTAPYHIDSGLYRFDACTSTPEPLVDWYTGDCCAVPVMITDTVGSVDIPMDGMVEVTINLSNVPVTVDKELFMLLDYSGANVAGNAGWIIAYEAEVGFTDDFWAEDIDGVGCGLFWFGGDPYAGFRATVWGASVAVVDMIPESASGDHTVAGYEIILDCHDLPQCVQVGVYARDWDPYDTGIPLVGGWQTRIGCDSYYTAPAGTLTASNTDCTPGPCDLCTMGIDKTRPDYIFAGMVDLPACGTVTLCPDLVSGAYGCLSGLLVDGVIDDHTAKYLNHYAFDVSADTRGTWTVMLDPNPLYTQLSDANGIPILPIARDPALITVEVGKCCYHIGPGTSECTDGVTECECEGQPEPNAFFPGEECSGEPDECDLGACCLPDGSCRFVNETECTALDGMYLGEGTTCAGEGVQVLPDEGLYFYQVDFTYPNAPVLLDSPYGLAVADLSEMASATGMSSGYLNIYTCADVECVTAEGWVVRNLPIDLSSGYPGISVMFDLGSTGDVTSLDAFAVLSPVPNICFSGTPDAQFPVGSRENNAEGGDAPRTEAPGGSVDVTEVLFDPEGETVHYTKKGFGDSIEQDNNQCCPASVANSLNWLKNKYHINVPDEHKPGIRDDKLVGELDKDMNRDPHGTAAIFPGKLKYIHRKKLSDELHIKHKKEDYNWPLLDNDVTHGTATSHVNNDATVSLIKWIIEEVKACEDVEVFLTWDDGGGHYICLTGAGYIKGKPYIEWIHDWNQGHDDKGTDDTSDDTTDETNGGTSSKRDGGHQHSEVDDNNGIIAGPGDGTGKPGKIRVAVSESPIYPKCHAGQYTATRYRAADGTLSGWVEDGVFKDLYDAPVWEDDTTWMLDNVALEKYYKRLCLDLLFQTAQATDPDITITTSTGIAPRSTKFEWFDYNKRLRITWELKDQPAWEKIHFPNASFKAMTNLDRMGVSPKCEPIPDCNKNGVDDRDEIDGGSAPDENMNGVPDECDWADCNSNDVANIDDIASGYSLDCNENGVPDECDVEDPEMDCNGNGVPDSCDTDAGGQALDCNFNRVPDECDIASGTSQDTNGDGVPDECEQEIPTVSQWGLVILAMLLMVVAKVYFRRREPVRR